MLNGFYIFLFLWIIGCGESQSKISYVKKSKHADLNQEKVPEDSLVYLFVDTGDPASNSLAQAMSATEGQVVFLVRVDDVDFEISKDSPLLLNSRGAAVSVRQTNPKASDSNSLKNIEVSSEQRNTPSTSIAMKSKNEASLKEDQQVKKDSNIFSKLFKSSKQDSQLENKVESEAILDKNQVVYQGAYLPHTGLLRQRLLKGFEVPRFEVNEKGEGSYAASTNDPHLYTQASLKIATAAIQSEIEKNLSVRQTVLAQQVVFKLKVKSSQGVDRAKNQQETKERLKIVDVYGKISPDQILGYYHVRNGDIVGEFQRNVYTSKIKRVTTKMSDGLNRFITDLSYDSDGAPKRETDWSRFDPHIPGTTVRMSRLRPNNY